MNWVWCLHRVYFWHLHPKGNRKFPNLHYLGKLDNKPYHMVHPNKLWRFQAVDNLQRNIYFPRDLKDHWKKWMAFSNHLNFFVWCMSDIMSLRGNWPEWEWMSWRAHKQEWTWQFQRWVQDNNSKHRLFAYLYLNKIWVTLDGELLDSLNSALWEECHDMIGFTNYKMK